MANAGLAAGTGDIFILDLFQATKFICTACFALKVHVDIPAELLAAMGSIKISPPTCCSLQALVGICTLAFSVRLFSVIKYESVIHEFDPYFNYRVTQFLTKHGFYELWNWFDDLTWYPLGRVIGGTVYPVSSQSFGWLHPCTAGLADCMHSLWKWLDSFAPAGQLHA